MRDAAQVLQLLEQAGVLGFSGVALQRKLSLDRSRTEAAITELWSQGLIKEVTYCSSNAWALRRGFSPTRVASRRWRLTAHGQDVVLHA